MTSSVAGLLQDAREWQREYEQRGWELEANRVRRLVDELEASERPVVHYHYHEAPIPPGHYVIERAKRLRVEIGEIFRDAEHWNKNVRVLGEQPIDPDPDGQLRAIIKGIDAMLRNEIRLA